MKKYLTIIILTSIFYINLKADILLIHKRIVPISLLQVKDIVNKKDKIITFVIVTNKNQIAKALRFKELLPSSIKSFTLNISIVYESDIIQYSNKNKIDAFYCFSLSNDICRFIANFAQQNSIVTFGHSKKCLEEGSLIYIEMTNKINIYLSKKTLKGSKINFNSQFLQIVELYD